jgi:hypothetical protein
LNTAARYVGYFVEKATRPVFSTTERVGYAALAVLAAIPAGPLGLVATGFYFLAALGKGQVEWIRSGDAPNHTGQAKIGFLNACFQYPWSPLTGGVVAPFDLVGEGKTRIEAIVDQIVEQNLDVFTGIEFEDYATRVEFQRLMAKAGFTEFATVQDVYGPALNNPGLFIASKAPLEEVEFIPFAKEDTAGLAKWAKMGLLAFKVNGLEILATHLNYGDEPEDAAARARQLQKYMAPRIREGAIGIGDLNVALKDQQVLNDLGLEDLRNAVADDTITCTNQGKIDMGRKDKTKLHEEKNIDGVLYHPEKTECGAVSVIQLRDDEGPLLSDHSMVIFTATKR